MFFVFDYFVGEEEIYIKIILICSSFRICKAGYLYIFYFYRKDFKEIFNLFMYFIIGISKNSKGQPKANTNSFK